MDPGFNEEVCDRKDKSGQAPCPYVIKNGKGEVTVSSMLVRAESNILGNEYDWLVESYTYRGAVTSHVHPHT